MITLRICIYFDLLDLLGKSVSWHPARTGSLPLTHSLGTLICWHRSCLNLSGLVAMQGAACSHPHPLTHVGWAQQTAGFSRDPQKSSPSFDAVPARSAGRAQGKPSISIPSHRCIRSSLAVAWDKDPGPNPVKCHTALIQAQKTRTKNGGTLSAIRWQSATYQSQNRWQDKAGITHGSVFQQLAGEKPSASHLKGRAPYFCTPPTANSRWQILHPRTVSCLEIKINFLKSNMR